MKRGFGLRCPSALLLASLFVAPMASAEIFKCTSKDGELTLQNFPCALDSIGSSAIVGKAANGVGATATAIVRGSAKSSGATPQRHTLRNMVPNGSEPNGEEPYPGMSMVEVKANWGDPKSAAIVNGFEVWYYDGSGDATRGVRFDHAGRVVAMDDEDQQ